MRLPGDAARAVARRKRTIEHRQVLRLEIRGVFDRVLFVDVSQDRFDLGLIVAQGFQRQRHRLVDDLQHAAAGQLLVLHQRDVRLDAGGVAVHHEADRAGGGKHRGLGIAEAVHPARRQNIVPRLADRLDQILGALGVDPRHRVVMLFHHPQERLVVRLVLVKSADRLGQFATGEVGRPMQERRNRPAHAAGGVRIVRDATRHQQAAQVRVAQSQRPEQVAVAGDVASRVAGMIDQNFLSDEERPASGLEPLGIKDAIRPAVLHEIDAGEVASRVVEEHVLRARVAGIDAAAVRARVPIVNRRVVLHAGIAAVPGTAGHAIEHFAGWIRRSGDVAVGHPMRGPVLVFLDGLHEVVGHPHRKVRVLEHDRAVGLAIEIGFVTALFNQHAGLLLFLPLALDELHHVGVPDLDRLHLGSAARLAAAFYDRGNLVVDPHEGQRSAGTSAAGKFFPVRPQRREVGAGTRAKLEEHRLAARELHDVFHVVLDMLNETRAALRELVRILRLGNVLGDRVPMPIAGGARYAVLMIEANIEPHGRIERAVLMQTKPNEVTVKAFAIIGAGEVAVLQSPIGNCAGDAMHQLANAVFALVGTHLTVEVFAADDVGG